MLETLRVLFQVQSTRVGEIARNGSDRRMSDAQVDTGGLFAAVLPNR